jgi:hypothetical protein
MKINVSALTGTLGLFWSMAILIVASMNLIWPTYGRPFLELIASVYPGYHAEPSLGQVAVGGLYGLLDGALCGLLLGWVYNFFSARLAPTA